MSSLQRNEYSNLKLARPLWEGDEEVVKRSGRDEPIWVVLCMCMEATLGISLYSYPYLKLAKTPCFSYYLLRFSSTKLENKRVEQVLPRGRGDGSPNNVYTYK
jgi:hypothetical protein